MNKAKSNELGTLLLKKTKLEYIQQIVHILDNNPSLIQQILEEMNITKEEFNHIIKNPEENNIVYYDEALRIIDGK